jgi:6-phosphogluconolactonase (cycloisomerase 2 family)
MRRPFALLLLAVVAGVLSWNCTYQKPSSGTGTKTVEPTVSPITPSVPLGAPQIFTVSISNGDSLSWAIGQLEGDGTVAPCPAATPCGSLTANSATTGTTAGVSFTYTAPTVMPQAGVSVANPNMVTLRVIDSTSTNANPPSVQATITLTTALAVTVAPQTANAEASNPSLIPFAATVSNDSKMGGVNWSLSSPGLTCTGTGPTPCGSISAASSASGTAINYTAPASAASSFKVTLTATSVTTSTVSNFAAITVTPAISVSVSPQTANIAASNPVGIPFTATVTNDVNSAGVNWTLSSPGLTCSGTTTCGTLSASSSTSGTPITYTAPAAATATFPVTLTATSEADGSKSNAATITVTPPISVNVAPPTANATAGSLTGIPFTATVSNDGNGGGVNWTLITTGGSCGGTTCGSLSATSTPSGTPVTYTAPPTAAATFAVTLTATSVTDASKSGFATITVSSPQNAILRYVFEAASAPPSGLTIASYGVSNSTGQLRSLTYFVPSGLGGGGITEPTPATAIHPNGTVLYVLAPSIPSSAQLWTLTLGPNGVLQQTASSPVTLNTELQGLTVDPLGQFLYATDEFGGAIDVLALDQNGNPGSPTAAATLSAPTQMLIDPSGSFLFATSSGSGSGMVSMFSINRGSSGTPGALTSLGTPLASGSDDTCMTVTPNGQFLYLFSDSTLYAFNVTPTGLTPVTGSPFSGLLGTSAPGEQMVVDPTSKYLYVTAQGPDEVYGFSIGASGTLTALPSSPFATGSFPDEINVDPSGSFVYVANREDAWVYSLNSSTGQLTPTSQMRTRGFGIANQLLSSGSSALKFTPTALYVANTGSNNISQFTINSTTGALTAGVPIGAGTAPKAVAVLPDGDFAYAANSAIASGVPTLSAYSISSGVLSPSGSPVPTGNGPTWLTPDLSGTWMYNVNQTDSSIWKFTISGSGTLTSGAQATTTGTGPVFVTTDPTGQYLYTANNTAGTISEYSIEMPQGSLSLINASLSAQGAQPVSIAVDPSGRYLYVAEMNNGTTGILAEYTLTEGSGDLVVNGPQPFLPIGSALSSVVVEPSGKYVFVSDFILSKIYSYTINSGVGDLTINPISDPVASTGTGPVALAVDISGQFLYCVNSGSNDISIFKINLTNGTLTQVGTTTVPTGGTTPAGLATAGTIN